MSAQKFSSVWFHNNFAFKIQACTKAIIIVRVSGIAVYTAMFTALIGIHGVAHANIGAGHFIHHLAGCFNKHFGFRVGEKFLIQALDVLCNNSLLQKAVCRVKLRAPAL